MTFSSLHVSVSRYPDSRLTPPKPKDRSGTWNEVLYANSPNALDKEVAELKEIGSRRVINSKQFVYRHGRCYYFALALYFELKYEIYGIYTSWNEPAHLIAKAPNGLFYDIGGAYTEQDWKTEYGYSTSIKPISRRELYDHMYGTPDVYASFEEWDTPIMNTSRAIIRAFPKVYKPYPVNIALARKY